MMGLNGRKPGTLHANNKGADQPVHPCSRISVFVICFLESKISKLASCKILIFNLVSVSKQVGLSHDDSYPEDRFSRDMAPLS